MQILEQQKTPIKHLVSQCKKQHGLILYHYMGTGKTLTALAFAKNYPDKKIVIICPYGLDNQWINEAKRIDIKLKNITFITFSDLQNKFITDKKSRNKLLNKIKNNILIIDEAHLICPILYDLSSDSKEKKDNSTSRKYSKITYSRRHVSYDIPELYEVMNVLNSSYKTLLLTATPFYYYLGDIRLLINLAAGKSVVPYNAFAFQNQYIEENPEQKYFEKWVKPIIEMNDITKTYFNEYIIKKIPGNKLETADAINPFNISRFANIITGTISSFLIKNNDIKTNKIFINAAKRTLETNLKIYVLSTILENFTPLVIDYMTKIYNSHFSNVLKKDELKKNNIGVYFSFYKYLDNTVEYPKVYYITKEVYYNNYQLDLWAKIINNAANLLSVEELLQLKFYNTKEELELSDPKTHHYNYYQNGKIIGNMIFNYKGKKIYPEKFIRILKIYKDNPISTIVYSNFFKSGILLFAKFLEEQGINFKIYEPELSNTEKNKIIDDFQNGDIKMLLLHPSYSQGFSIKGCRIYHILEPLSSYPKMKQLETRVIRYHSHTHLPKKYRNVTIIIWKCSINNIIEQLRYRMADVKLWKDHQLEEFYFKRVTTHSSLYTPDEIAYKRYNDLFSFYNNFEKTIKSISIEKNKLKDTCCIWNDKDCKYLPNCIEEKKLSNSKK